MSEPGLLLLVLAAGGGLGAVFFGGLLWTVRRAVSSSRPALWFASSLLLRTALVVAGFHLVGGADWQRLLACLAGFVLARQVVSRLTRLPSDTCQQTTARS